MKINRTTLAHRFPTDDMMNRLKNIERKTNKYRAALRERERELAGGNWDFNSCKNEKSLLEKTRENRAYNKPEKNEPDKNLREPLQQ